jgi:chaperone modulatory protein CbpM
MSHTEISIDVVEGTLTLIEFCDHTQLTTADVVEMVDVGMLEPVEMTGLIDEYRFLPHNLRRARMAKRLMRDMGINLNGIAMIIDLIEARAALLNRISILERMLETDPP